MFETTEEFLQHKRLKRETETSRNTEEAFRKVIDSVSDSVIGYFARNRKLKGGELKELFASIDRSVRGGMMTVRFRSDTRAPTKARPKSEAYEAMYVVVSNQQADSSMREMLYRLHAIRVFGTRKRIEVETRPLPVAFYRHAAARLHERGSGIEHAIEEIAAFLQDWAMLPVLAEDALEAAGSRRFALPGPSAGLVMGCTDAAAAVPPGFRYCFDAVGCFVDAIPADPLSPSLYCGKTYIGSFDIQKEQTELRDCFEMWRDACGESYEAALEDLIWPFREIIPASGPHIEDRLLEALSNLVSDRRAICAMDGRASTGRMGWAVSAAKADELEALPVPSA